MAGPPPCLLLELTRRYSEPHRHYHTIEHIAAMLHHGRGLQLSDAQLLAIWFHDAVYDPRALDNEERSAALAVQLLPAAGFAAPLVALVQRIVLDTKTHVPSLPESAAVIDLDLGSLALPWEKFRRNSAFIRAEYAHVPDAEFVAGRRAFLQRMLDRPRLFWTAFGAPLEPLARGNLARAIAADQAPGR
ncbi:MAG TPA: metal-dependent phosphohydrolase [Planctomycetota bacterium]|nr:metal-dependent phosphohydrolase [Planctomycetota bacterium]